MERTPLLAGNWKMHATLGEARALVRGLAERVGNRTDREVLVAPPFTALAAVAEAVRGSRILVAAQNMHQEDKGAFTGEISPLMVRDAGATHVVLGHSERRQLFGETDEVVRRKVEAALKHDLIPVVCVGETLAERDADQTFAVVDRHLDGVLTHVEAPQAERVVIAYEPVWAIGTGRTATPQQAQEVHLHIRLRLAERFGDATAARMRIQYGGSVKAANAAALMAEPDIDGALVGGASLDAAEFAAIVAAARPA
jgi:triosephosphate isomerase